MRDYTDMHLNRDIDEYTRGYDYGDEPESFDDCPETMYNRMQDEKYFYAAKALNQIMAQDDLGHDYYSNYKG